MYFYGLCSRDTTSQTGLLRSSTAPSSSTTPPRSRKQAIQPPRPHKRDTPVSLIRRLLPMNDWVLSPFLLPSSKLARLAIGLGRVECAWYLWWCTDPV